MQINAASTTTMSADQTSSKNDAKLHKACQDFESMMVSQMLSQMRQTVQKTDLFGSSEHEEIFQGMLDNQIANNVAQSGSMGIAKMLYEQISQQQAKKS
jgi:flagellar protein FlgJ